LFVAWVIFHVMTCIALILVVLMQSAKGEGLAGGTAFGGGMSGAVFGGRGAATFLSKATTVLAVVFMVNCGGLAFLSSQSQTVNPNAPGSNVTESAVTRQAQAERDAAMSRQAEQQEAALQDSMAAQGNPLQLLDLPTETPTETPAGTETGSPDTSGN
jgi:preprotein translocase subunit SecG